MEMEFNIDFHPYTWVLFAMWAVGFAWIRFLAINNTHVGAAVGTVIVATLAWVGVGFLVDESRDYKVEKLPLEVLRLQGTSIVLVETPLTYMLFDESNYWLEGKTVDVVESEGKDTKVQRSEFQQPFKHLWDQKALELTHGKGYYGFYTPGTISVPGSDVMYVGWKGPRNPAERKQQELDTRWEQRKIELAAAREASAAGLASSDLPPPHNILRGQPVGAGTE